MDKPRLREIRVRPRRGVFEVSARATAYGEGINIKVTTSEIKDAARHILARVDEHREKAYRKVYNSASTDALS